MNRFVLIAVLLLACRTGTLAQSAPPPAVDAPTLPGWRISGGDPHAYLVAADTANRYSGRASASLRSRVAARADGYASLLQSIRADEYRGRRVRFSGYLRMQDLLRGGSLWLRVDGQGQALAFDDMGEPRRHRVGTTDWVLHEVVLDVPPSAVGLAFGAVIAGTGTLWVDELRREIVGPDVAVTSAPAPLGPVDATQLLSQLIRYRQRAAAPQNLGFDISAPALRP